MSSSQEASPASAREPLRTRTSQPGSQGYLTGTHNLGPAGDEQSSRSRGQPRNVTIRWLPLNQNADYALVADSVFARSIRAEYLFCTSAWLISLCVAVPRPWHPGLQAVLGAEPAESRARRGRNMSHSRRTTADTGTTLARAASTWWRNLQNVPLGPVAPTYIVTAPAPRCPCSRSP